MQSHGKDIKGQTLSAYAGNASAAITAGTGSDNSEITGDSVDIQALAKRPASVCFEIPIQATLADTETMTATGLIEKSADGSSWSTLLASATLLTLLSDGGSTEKGVARMGADIVESDCRYVRYKITPDLSASGTDTMQIGAGVAVFGGVQET